MIGRGEVVVEEGILWGYRGLFGREFLILRGGRDCGRDICLFFWCKENNKMRLGG